MSSQESLQEELDSIRQAIKGLLAALDAQLADNRKQLAKYWSV